MSQTLLLVDDEEAILRSLARLFRNQGYELLTATSAAEALHLLELNDVQVILSDQRMPVMTGVEMLSLVRERYPEIIRMILSGYSDITAISDAVNKGNIYKFLFKPWDNDLLLENIRDAFERYGLTQKGAQFSRIYENTVEGIVITDQNTAIQAVNPAFTTITGYAPHEVIGKTPALLKSDEHPPAFFQEMWATLHEKGKWTGEIWNRRKNGEKYPEWLNITEIRDAQGRISQYVGLFNDVTEHKRNEEQLRYQAYHDALTGLPNRLLFGENLELALGQAERSGQVVAVLLMDLDRFKFVNDTFGHDYGDKLLVMVAERLRSVIRKGDTLARMGGDEFTLLLPTIRESDDIVRVIKKILHEFTRPFTIEKNDFIVTVSIGASIYPQDGNTPETVLKNADSAMYKAKEDGRNNYAFFTATMNEQMKRRIIVENELHKAIEGGELEVYYQPKQRLADGVVVGMEALVRWNHPVRGLVSPSEFIPIAESTGQIVPLGKFVLEEACRRTAAWNQAGLGNLQVAVNFSAYQLRDGDLLEIISNALKQSDLMPHQLEAELTESLVMQDVEASIEELVQLKRLGVSIAIDDFGTGYSSLSYLKRLPVDTLKVDQSFVRDVVSDQQDAELVRAIIGMAHGFKLKVVAEGVESVEQLEFLRQNGCDIIQGYWLARPMPAGDFAAFLSTGRTPFNGDAGG
ncbi:MAG: EAL domain-containing protein [Sulfuricella sp.]|nr:EAL domain-containing protein [Sulfuricella sp.]